MLFHISGLCKYCVSCEINWHAVCVAYTFRGDSTHPECASSTLLSPAASTSVMRSTIFSDYKLYAFSLYPRACRFKQITSLVTNLVRTSQRHFCYFCQWVSTNFSTVACFMHLSLITDGQRKNAEKCKLSKICSLSNG